MRIVGTYFRNRLEATKVVTVLPKIIVGLLEPFCDSFHGHLQIA